MAMTDKMLRAKDVAEILCIGRTQALLIISELPHVDVSSTNAKRNRQMRIRESVLMAYIDGAIERKPQGSAECEIRPAAKTHKPKIGIRNGRPQKLTQEALGPWGSTERIPYI